MTTTPPPLAPSPAIAEPAGAARGLLRLVPKEARYLAVGVTCAGVYNVALITVVTLGLGYLPATVLLLGPMILLGYGLHAAVTFGTGFTLAGLGRYGLTMILAYPLWLAILALLTDGLGLGIAVATPVGTVLLFLVNYLGAHWAIVRSLRAAFRRGPPGADRGIAA